MKEAIAYCPAAVSLIFRFNPHRNILKYGSLGLGFTVDQGIICRLEKSGKTGIYFNGLQIQFPTLSSVLEKVTKYKYKIYLTSPLPLGFGFGLSAAGTISALLALKDIQYLKLTLEDIARLVHVSEIENKTGLGTVGTIMTGGFLLKTAPGLPVKAQKFPFSGKKIYVTIIGKMVTPSVLGDKKKLERINRAADRALKKISQRSTLESILDISYEYDLESGLLRDRKLLKIIGFIHKAGGHACMAKLGKVIISDIKPEQGYNYQIQKLYISDYKVI